MLPIRPSLALAAAALALCTIPAFGQDKEAERRRAIAEAEEKAKARESEERKNPAKPAPRGKQVLKLYEWGVETMRWDGGPEPEFDDVPALYYDASEVKIESGGRPDTPKPDPQPKQPRPDDGGAKPRKPVIYFECDSDVTFDLDVRFSKGRVTWMYPKPSRRADAATVQWDNVMLFSDKVTARDATPAMPPLAKIDEKHWACFSREGSTSSLLVNGEAERFLFYEGENNALPEVDVFKDATNSYVIRNYSAHTISRVRVTLTEGGKTRTWSVASIPPAKIDIPGECVLSNGPGGPDFFTEDAIISETRAAGLTEEQARVFDRAWRATFFKVSAGATLSYMRSPKALDEMMELKVTLPEGFGQEQCRVGYVFIHGIDFERQAELAKLVNSAAAGNSEDAAKLKKLGMAAVGAMRRLMADEKLPLATRVAVAKLLGEHQK